MKYVIQERFTDDLGFTFEKAHSAELFLGNTERDTSAGNEWGA
jgi:hypothetical protein